MIYLLVVVDYLWHHGPYQLTTRWAALHEFMHRRVCTPVAEWVFSR